MTPFETFAPELRRLGFRKTWSTRAGGIRVDEWKLTPAADPDREVTAQVWADGEHRVSHGRHGHETTRPTQFRDIPGLQAAVRHESTRTDGGKR